VIHKFENDKVLAGVAAANPISAADLRAEIGDDMLDRAMSRAIAAAESSSHPIQPGDRVAREFGAAAGARPRLIVRRPGTRLGLGVGLACLLILALTLLSGGSIGGGGGRPSFAAAAIRVAEVNPRLLVTAPGWKVVRADEFEADSGELTFSNGSHDFEVHWYPAHYYGGYLRDRASVSDPVTGTLLGQRSTTVHYGHTEYATMLSPQGHVFIEVRGDLGSKRGYEEILDSLRPVDVDTWLGAMPASTVMPDARAAAVAEMLRGIPLPPAFDATGLQNEGSISNHDVLAMKVTFAVACGWVESWLTARAAGDGAAAREAVDAMASSPTWPIIRLTQGPWSSNIRTITGQLERGRLNRGPAGYEVLPDGRSFAYGPAYAISLGCKGRYRREVDSAPR
jgi:hypothetical protein